MDNYAKEGFDIPPGYTLEEIDGQLYHEDLDKDDELWLIRMPCDIKLSNLDKKKIYLSNNSGDTSIKNIKTDDGKLLECYTETCEIPSACVVLPQKNDGQLHVVKKIFKGSLLISEGLSYNEIEIKAENERLDDANLIYESTKEKSGVKKQLHCNLEATELAIKPDNGNENLKATAASQNIKEKKAKKKHKQSLSNIDVSEIGVKSENEELFEKVPNSANEPREKKNKKKKKQSQFNFDSSELNYETEDTDKHFSELQKKHKKQLHTHKKTLFESVEIKNEPLLMDWDKFPMCTSQK